MTFMAVLLVFLVFLVHLATRLWQRDGRLNAIPLR